MHPLSTLSCLRTTGHCFGLMLMLACTPDVVAQEPGAAAETDQLRPAVLGPSRSQVHEQSLERLLPTTQQRRLNIGEQTFLGLFLPAARPQAWGGIILIAGQDEHADWPTLIGPARRQLSAAGWHTLAISLPEREPAEAGAEDAEPAQRDIAYREQILARIQAARRVLMAEAGDQRDLPVALLGRGEGAFWALSAAVQAQADSPLAAALILQGLRQSTEGEGSTVYLLEQWSGHTYDILMSRPEHAEARRLQAKRLGHGRYRQLMWPQGENSDLQQEMLIKRLDGWLQRALNENPDNA